MSLRYQQKVLLDAYERGEISAEEALEFLRALHHKDELSQEEVARVEKDLEKLLSEPELANRQLLIKRSLSRYRSPLLVRKLFDEALNCLSYDRTEALALQSTATQVLNQCRASDRADELRASLTALLATIYKIEGRLQDAERLFVNIQDVVNSSTASDPVVKGHVCLLAGSFWKDRRQLLHSEEILRRGVLCYELALNEVAVARIRMVLSTTLFYQDRLTEAIALLQQALDAIDERLEPILFLMAHHNLALYLCQDGQPQEAARRLQVSAPLYQASRERWLLAPVHFHWLAGRIHMGLERLKNSEEHLIRAREGFLSKGTRYDAVLVCLDLSMVYLKSHQPSKVLELGNLMLSSSLADGLHQEALAAIRIFAEAARAHTIDSRLVQQVSRFLEFARQDHSLSCKEFLHERN